MLIMRLNFLEPFHFTASQKRIRTALSGLFLLGILSHTISGQRFLQKLAPTINSEEYDEISPVINGRNGLIYFTRIASPEFEKTLIFDEKDLSETLSEADFFAFLSKIYNQLGEEKRTDPINSNFNQDVFISNIEDETIDYHPGYPLNNALPNSVCAYIPDTKEVILINQFYQDGSMYRGFSVAKHIRSDSFAFPKPIHIYDFYTNTADVSLTMSEDKEIIILALKRKDSFGESDLYVCFKMREGLYSAPKNLGPQINTKAREGSPFISKDKRRIFFSSDRNREHGDTDIYVSFRQDFGYEKWSKPVALPEPINSKFDDGEPFLSEETGYLFFTSRRDGSSDIFKFNLEPPSILNPEIVIHGQIINAETGRLMGANLYYGPAESADYLEFFRSANGLFRTKLKINQVMKFYPEKNRFEGQEIRIDPNILVLQGKNEATLRLFLDPVSQKLVQQELVNNTLNESSIPIDFSNIQFERTKAIVLKSSYTTLNRLARYLLEHRDIRIRIEGHTDNVGEKELLQDLSIQRARIIRNYLIGKGVGRKRIEIAGFGAKKPLNENLTEEERAANRRVEIIVIE